MIPVVAFVGHHDSGKTRLITSLLPLLRVRGLRVGTVKLSPQLDSVDQPNTDSARLFAAGAHRVLLRGERDSALFWSHVGGDLREELDRLFHDCDLVIVEGGKKTSFPKIEVFRSSPDLRREPLAGTLEVEGVVTDDRVALSDGVALFSSRELEEVADYVEQLAFGRSNQVL